MKILVGSIALLILFTFSTIVSAQDPALQSEKLFKVNDKAVTAGEFVYLFKKNHQKSRGEYTKEKMEEYLELFINFKLKVEEARSRGMDTTASFRKEYKTYREELLKPYLPDARVVDSLVRLTYERLKEEVHAAHILVAVSPDASAKDTLLAYQKISQLREQIEGGEDFNAIARVHSEEPGAASSGGDLGYFTAMQMVFPFEQAAYTTPVGSISEPVRTRFGYHIVKVIDRQPSRGEVEVSHIMIRGNPENKEEARDLIFDVHDRLQKGVAWDELCREFSEDQSSKDKGGRLRPFGVGAMAAVPEFQEMAFSLSEPGEISDPIHTRYGWHILKLESKIPLPPFAEMKPALTQRVMRDERIEISRQALRRRLMSKFNFAEKPKVKSQLLELGDSVQHISAALRNQVLFSLDGKDYLVEDFLKFIDKKDVASTDKIEEHYIAFSDEAMRSLLEAEVIKSNPDHEFLLNEYYEGILLFEIMEKEIWNKAVDDTLGQKQFFNDNLAKYSNDSRMLGAVLSAGDAEVLRKLTQQAPGEWASIVKKNNIKIDSGTFKRSDRHFFSEVPWQPGRHLISSRGGNYLVSIEKILPPLAVSFDDVKAAVISDYQSHLEKAWITKLKRKFGVKVDKKVRKRVFEYLLED